MKLKGLNSKPVFDFSSNPSDLNDIAVNGIYACGDYNSIKNIPVGNVGVLLSFFSSPFMLQIYVTYNSMYIRISTDFNKNWSDWVVK